MVLGNQSVTGCEGGEATWDPLLPSPELLRGEIFEGHFWGPPGGDSVGVCSVGLRKKCVCVSAYIYTYLRYLLAFS